MPVSASLTESIGWDRLSRSGAAAKRRRLPKPCSGCAPTLQLIAPVRLSMCTAGEACSLNRNLLWATATQELEAALAFVKRGRRHLFAGRGIVPSPKKEDTHTLCQPRGSRQEGL